MSRASRWRNRSAIVRSRSVGAEIRPPLPVYQHRKTYRQVVKKRLAWAAVRACPLSRRVLEGKRTHPRTLDIRPLLVFLYYWHQRWERKHEVGETGVRRGGGPRRPVTS